MKKLILIYLLCLLIFSFSIGKASGSSEDNKLFEFAYISGTSYLNFQENTYDVYINYNDLNYVTGNDNKQYPCYTINGTGKTDTMGEVYFSYQDKNSYVCADGKYRGYAKIGAGGWIEFEDSEKSPDNERWSVYKNKRKDESDSNYYYHTGEAFSDGIGMWEWSTAKTKQQVRAKIYNEISNEKSNVNISTGAYANLNDKAILNVTFKDGGGNLLNGLYFDNFKFGSGDFVWDDGGSKDKGLFFSGLKNDINSIDLSTGKISTGVYSILPFSGNFNVIGNYDGVGNNFKLSGNTFFDAPFTGNFVGTGKNGKNIMGETATGNISYITGENIDNISFNSNTGSIYLSGKGNYTILSGEKRTGTDNFNFKFVPYTKKTDNNIYVFYKINGNYDININGNNYENIDFSDEKTTNEIFYPDKEIEEVNIKKSDCDNVKGDSKELCELMLTLKNEHGYYIPNLNFDISVKDSRKDYNGDKEFATFDLIETDNDYNTGLFLSGSSSGNTSLSGSYNFDIYSYKPVFFGKLQTKLYNITGDTSKDIYNRSQSYKTGVLNDIDFDKVIDVYFSGQTVGDKTYLDENNEIDLVFKTGDNVDNIKGDSEELYLSGNLKGCDDCSFSSGGKFFWTGFKTEKVKIKTEGSEDPDRINYTGNYYKYEIDGYNGIKNIKIKPSKWVHLNDLFIDGKFFGLELSGMLKNAFNMNNAKDIGINVEVVGSSISFSKYLNDLKKDIMNEIRGKNKDILSGNNPVKTINNINGSDKIYKCVNPGDVVEIDLVSNKVNGDNKYIFIDCKLKINSDIKLQDNNADSLEIVSLSSNSEFMDYRANNGWNLNSNIVITKNVDTIFADITTNGSILFSKSDSISKNDIFVEDRENVDNLEKQIYIKGNITSRNTFGGALGESPFKLPGGKSYDKSDIIFDDIDPIDAAKAYDINFWRGTYSGISGNYNTGDVSDYISNNYDCNDGDESNDDNICTKPVVIEGSN